MTDSDDPWKGRMIVGIDLGTTNSGLAVWDEKAGRVRMVADAAGRELMPSLVLRDAQRRAWVVGHEAQPLRALVPGATAYSVKRFIGRRFGDPTVVAGRRSVGYRLVDGAGRDALRDVLVDFGTEDGVAVRLSVPEVSAKVLAHLCRGAAETLGLPDGIRHAVITVPAYFNVLQREATKLAGKLAGLQVVDILDEPTAAALATCRDLLEAEQKRILVYDLGGGTFDVSLLEASRDEDGYAFYTRAVDGDTCLGGDDIDARLAEWLAECVRAERGRAEGGVLRERLRCAAEEAKVALSDAARVTLRLEALDAGDGPPFDVSLEVGADVLERCAADVVRRTQEISDRVVSAASLGWDQIDEVILVGGQTLMPAVRRAVEELFGRPPRCSAQPQFAVALGAGEYARIKGLGRERFHEDTLSNVIPLPLGIRLDTEGFETLVRANAPVPYVSPPYHVTTRTDYQDRILVEVLQGRRGATSADQCIVLGSIPMDVPPAPAGTHKFAVEFEVASDGTMKVAVTDTRLNRRQVLDILATRLEPEDGSAPRG
jgi:molecular chaperone DnaK